MTLSHCLLGNSRITGQGTGLKVNATCHLNGTIEFSSHISVPSDGFQIDYNCTGNDPTEVKHED